MVRFVVMFALLLPFWACKNETGTNPEQQFRLTGPTLFLAPGILKSPEGIAVDRNGNIWVADSRNNLLRKLTPQGMQIGSIAFAAVIPRKVAIEARTGDLLVVMENGRIDRIVAETKSVLSSDLLIPFTGDASAVYDVNTRATRPLSVSISQLGDLASGPTGDIFIAAHGSPQNAIIKNVNGNLSAVAYSSLSPDLNTEVGPRFLAVDNFGTVFTSFTMLSTAGNNVTRVYAFNSSAPSQSRVLNEPVVTGAARGAAIDASGYLYIAEPLLQELVVISTTDGRTVQRIGIPDITGISVNRAPQDVAVAADGSVYVVVNDLQNPSAGNGAVLKYTRMLQ